MDKELNKHHFPNTKFRKLAIRTPSAQKLLINIFRKFLLFNQIQLVMGIV